MASSDSGSKGADRVVPPSTAGDRVGLKIPLFRWRHRQWYFFIGFRLRRHHQVVRWPWPQPPGQADSQLMMMKLGGEGVAPPAPPNNDGNNQATNEFRSTHTSGSLEAGLGWDEDYGVTPPDDDDGGKQGG